MKTKILPLGALALFVSTGFLMSGKVNQVNAEGILDKPVNSVKPYIQIRPRYEYVHQSNTPNTKDAKALTTRIKVGVKLNGLFQVDGLNAVLEGVDVEAIVDDYDKSLKHDDKIGNNNYETVLDPDQARLTQAYISYTINKTTLFFGRKYVAIDDHRFIGTVDWRQMPQSFGVVGIQDNTINGLNILIAGIYERKGITDVDEDWASQKIKIINADWKAKKMPIIIDISYKIIPAIRVKAFSYLITDIHNTYGFRTDGRVNLGSIKLSYLGEYAIQKDPYETYNLDKNNKQKPDIDTSYYRLGGNLAFNTGGMGTFFGGVEYTHFGDKNNKDKGFSTPLATLHKFEGWSDVLLKGAAGGYDYGMNELKLTFGYKHSLLGKFIVSYLDFKSDKTPNGVGDNIGSEWDFAYTKNFGKHFSILLKGAVYDGKDGYVSGGSAYGKNDTTKYWAQLNFVY